MIEILLESSWFLVINKPSGVLTQAVPGIDSVQTLLVRQLQDKDPEAPKPFIGIPHRLDRVTSGAMVVARNQRALRRLSDQFAARKVNKIYHAMVPRISDSADGANGVEIAPSWTGGFVHGDPRLAQQAGWIDRVRAEQQ